MDKEKIIEDFFRSLKVALVNAFAYSKDHPYFIKFAEDLQAKLETLLGCQPLFRVGVTDVGLVVDGKKLTRVGFYDELARLLHQRRIESIEISQGFTLDELIVFLGIISLPQKDFSKAGTLSLLLAKAKLAHFKIQELDYSAFLQGSAGECTDVWGYLLKEAAYSDNAHKIDQLADSFGTFIKRADEKGFFDAAGLSPEVNAFLICLKDKNKEKYSHCLSDLFLWLLHNKKTLTTENLAQLNPAFAGLSPEEFTMLLKEGFAQEENFDSLSLQLFSKISTPSAGDKIVQKFFGSMQDDLELKDDSAAVNKIRNLISNSVNHPISEVYRNTLDALASRISYSGSVSFDQKQLKENYYYLLLDILATEDKAQILEVAVAILKHELPMIFADNFASYLRDLWEILAKKNGEHMDSCAQLQDSFAAQLESLLLNDQLTPEENTLLALVPLPGKEPQLYLEKIFAAEKINQYILNSWFKLFPEQINIFNTRVQQRAQDIDFLSGLIVALGEVDALGAQDSLMRIYSWSNELIKIQILKIMRQQKIVNVEFLMRQLDSASFLLRKNILSVLILDANAVEGALDALLGISDFWGRQVERLIENMQIVFQFGLIRGLDRIKILSQRKFFWQRKLRAQAKQILKEWNVK